MPQKHKLGWGNGRIVEFEDGTAGYIPSASLTQAFRVRIADVTGFSVTKGGKLLERQINVLGNGTLLGSAVVGHGVSEAIEAWFKSHPLYGGASEAVTAPGGPTSAGVADEIRKLGELLKQGLITEQEFADQKARLLK
jgi:hypothetical protein